MFISVWQGGNKFVLVNSNCMVRNLLDYLRTRLKITDPNVTLDLADEEGNLQNLPEHHPRRNALRLVQGKVTYIPVLIERNDDGTLKPFTPMVKRMRRDQDFMRQLVMQYEQRERIRRGPVAGRNRQDSLKERGPTKGAAGKRSATSLKKGTKGKPSR